MTTRHVRHHRRPMYSVRRNSPVIRFEPVVPRHGGSTVSGRALPVDRAEGAGRATPRAPPATAHGRAPSNVRRAPQSTAPWPRRRRALPRPRRSTPPPVTPARSPITSKKAATAAASTTAPRAPRDRVSPWPRHEWWYPAARSETFKQPWDQQRHIAPRSPPGESGKSSARTATCSTIDRGEERAGSHDDPSRRSATPRGELLAQHAIHRGRGFSAAPSSGGPAVRPKFSGMEKVDGGVAEGLPRDVGSRVAATGLAPHSLRLSRATAASSRVAARRPGGGALSVSRRETRAPPIPPTDLAPHAARRITVPSARRAPPSFRDSARSGAACVQSVAGIWAVRRPSRINPGGRPAGRPRGRCGCR